MNECTILVLGATGDLAKRKLIPAIYKLLEDKKLTKFALVGAAFSDGNRDDMLDGAKEFMPEINEQIWQQLHQSSYYQQLDFGNAADYKKLKTLIEQCEQQHGLQGNRLVYLASAAHFFCPITRNLGQTGIILRNKKDEQPWHRIVYEKPFGVDLHSAQEINKCIATYLNESQVYRIDHYLTKELVSNISLIRFTNIIFEPLWNNKYIDNVQIRINESIGLEGRGRYYDKYGVLKDVVQNHALQLLALIGMEAPSDLAGEHIRDQKTKVLQKTSCDAGIFGQYTGYHREQDVDPDSQTPTYGLLRMAVDTPRWKGVPFYIETGKRLKRKDTVISIQFKDIMCPLVEGRDCPSNSLIMHIAPEPSFGLELNVKPVGLAPGVVPVIMDFSHAKTFGPKTPEAYETLLESVLAGDQAISVRFDEIEQSWRVVEQIEEMNLPLYKYAQGSAGPKEAEQFLQKYNVRWQK